ncbi:hypothetical protein ANCDUO_25335 [Ancylostoma duodenale]|uniref:Uncharacterized protein n=1 Tax=Ancylostoma duodenale TaxID=51022 RepID=A0A0C2FD31_9BILA|nr:hypothetical protein ANCDUO_25335 [Ancylostoma duodenale]
MNLPTREATGTVRERTPPPSVAPTLETDHSWFGTIDELKTTIIDDWEDVESDFLSESDESPEQYAESPLRSSFQPERANSLLNLL